MINVVRDDVMLVNEWERFYSLLVLFLFLYLIFGKIKISLLRFYLIGLSGSIAHLNSLLRVRNEWIISCILKVSRVFINLRHKKVRKWPKERWNSIWSYVHILVSLNNSLFYHGFCGMIESTQMNIIILIAKSRNKMSPKSFPSKNLSKRGIFADSVQRQASIL